MIPYLVNRDRHWLGLLAKRQFLQSRYPASERYPANSPWIVARAHRWRICETQVNASYAPVVIISPCYPTARRVDKLHAAKGAARASSALARARVRAHSVTRAGQVTPPHARRGDPLVLVRLHARHTDATDALSLVA